MARQLRRKERVDYAEQDYGARELGSRHSPKEAILQFARSGVDNTNRDAGRSKKQHAGDDGKSGSVLRFPALFPPTLSTMALRSCVSF